MNEEASRNFMNDVYDRYVLPEVDRRRKEGSPVDLEVWAAQVLFDSSQPNPRVRLNREVRLVGVQAGTAEAKDYVELYNSGCRAFSSVTLAPDEINIRHVTLYQLGVTTHWGMLFNFSSNGGCEPTDRRELLTGYQVPIPTVWESLCAEHQRVLELILSVNSPVPVCPIEAVMGVALQRSRHLTEAYESLLKTRNLTAGSALIRMQLDSAMRVNACFLVSDPMQIWNALKSGDPWRAIKASDGKELTDSYLHQQLSDRCSWATDVYKQMSGYIHLSRPHLKSAVDGEDFLGMVLHQGPAGARVTDQEVSDNAGVFVKVTQALLLLCEDYAKSRNDHGNDPPLLASAV